MITEKYEPILMKLFLLLLFFSPFLDAAYYSKEKLLEKLQEPPKQWMLYQIQEDLSPFVHSGISKKLIAQTLKDVYRVPIAWNKANLVRIGIANNVAYSMERYQHYRMDGLVNFLNELAKNVTLPNLEFLFSLWDFYDNPSFLENTSSPVFIISKYKYNRKAVAVPDVTFLQNRYDNATNVLRVSAATPWEKRIDIPFWRGATTDMPYTESGWDYRPRARLVLFSLNHPDVVNARFSHPAWLEDSMLNYFKELEIIGDWRAVPLWIDYRYLLAVDGVAFPGCFNWELLSGSTTLKQDSEFIEWFYQALQPFVHYVPYKEDCSDLEEKVQWLRTHQQEAKQIAQNALDFAIDNLENEDIMLYYYLLLKEYAKLWKNE